MVIVWGGRFAAESRDSSVLRALNYVTNGAQVMTDSSTESECQAVKEKFVVHL